MIRSLWGQPLVAPLDVNAADLLRYPESCRSLDVASDGNARIGTNADQHTIAGLRSYGALSLVRIAA